MSIQNTEDAIWFKIEPTISSIRTLGNFIDWNEYTTNHELIDDYNSFQRLLESVYIENESVTAYIVLGKYVHIIVKKIKNYNIFVENIEEAFSMGQDQL